MRHCRVVRKDGKVTVAVESTLCRDLVFRRWVLLHVPVIVDRCEQAVHVVVGRHVFGGRCRVSHLIFGEGTSRDDVVLAAPGVKSLGPDSVVMERRLRLVLVLALDQVAVEMALAEAVKRYVVLLRPGDEPGKLDFVIAECFNGACGFAVEEELAEGFVPGETG